MRHKKLSAILITAFGFCHFVFGAAWEGSDNFSSGISTNWTVQPNHGSMTIQAANGHASYLVAPSASTEQNAYLLWKRNPTVSQDWTVQISGHNAANWSSSGASQFQLVAGDFSNGEAFVIECYRGNSGIKILTSMWQNLGAGPNTTRQTFLATNTDFNLRLTYSAVTGNIYAWYNLTGSWVLLDTFNIASFPTTLPPSDNFSFAIIADTYYGPITEGQLYADNFALGQPPQITNQPTSRTNAAGTSATFLVLAGGTAPLSYQWQFNNTNISGATLTNYTIASVQGTNAGNYSVVITNTAGSITSSMAALTVLFKPTITNQPISVTNALGTTANFSVFAGGALPLSYQWRFSNTNILGATLTNYTIASVQGTNAGNYNVVITNIAGSVTSSVAALTVIFPPSITNQFVSQTVVRGSNATFTVGASGALPLAYQWRTNGIVFPGRITNWLTLTNFQSTNEGHYDVVITNMAGSITSASAMLYFLPSNNASRLTSPSFVSNRFTLLLLGKATTNLIIQTSTNLTTWTPLITNTSSSGVINFTDTNVVSDKRFYRARTP